MFISSYHSQKVIFIPDGAPYLIGRNGSGGSVSVNMPGLSATVFDFDSALAMTDGNNDDAEFLTALIWKKLREEISAGNNAVSVDDIIKKIGDICDSILNKLGDE